MFNFSNRLSKGFLNRPTITIEPAVQGDIFYIKPAAPLFNSESLPFIFYINICAFVIFLLSGCGPSTIIGIVSLIIINAIYRMVSCGSWSDIIQKGAKRFSPRFTDGYTSTPIVFKIFCVRVMASFFHSSPYLIFRGFCFSVGTFFTEFGNYFFLQTPTRLGPSVLKVYPGNSARRPTNTPAQPVRAVISALCGSEDSPSIKSFTGQVLNFPHNYLQAKITSILRCAESKMLEVLRFGSYPIHTDKHIKNIDFCQSIN